MSNQLFSRAHLQARPLEYKRAIASELINTFIRALLSAADSGRTSYLFDMTNTDYISQIQQPNAMKQSIWTPSYTMPLNELIPLFQERFPDCNITYEELWTDANPNTKVLKKGILIDWS